MGIGLTFRKSPDQASGGLPVHKVKDYGPAVHSGICPGDIVVTIDGEGPLGMLDVNALTLAVMGPPRSIAKVEVLRKQSGQREMVAITRAAPSLGGNMRSREEEQQRQEDATRETAAERRKAEAAAKETLVVRVYFGRPPTAPGARLPHMCCGVIVLTGGGTSAHPLSLKLLCSVFAAIASFAAIATRP